MVSLAQGNILSRNGFWTPAVISLSALASKKGQSVKMTQLPLLIWDCLQFSRAPYIFSEKKFIALLRDSNIPGHDLEELSAAVFF